MTRKLTLTVDSETIERAKEYAREQGESLSKIVENYLELISSKPKNKVKESPLISSMRGSFKAPKDFDYKKELQEALEKKYMK